MDERNYYWLKQKLEIFGSSKFRIESFIGQLKNKEIEFYALRPLYCLHLSLHKIIPKTFNFWSSNRFNEKFLSKSLSIANVL